MNQKAIKELQKFQDHLKKDIEDCIKNSEKSFNDAIELANKLNSGKEFKKYLEVSERYKAIANIQEVNLIRISKILDLI